MPSKSSKKSTAQAASAELAASLTEAEQDLLFSLSDEIDQYPDRPVRRQLFSARKLVAAGRKLADVLLSRSDLDADVFDQLEQAASMLERAELLWSDARQRRAAPELVAARKDAEAFKREAMAVLRYFLRHDAETQSRLDEIAEGVGDGDLVDDLRRLSDLVVRHRAALARAKHALGDQPAARGRALAKRLEAAAIERDFDAAAADALALRNRAFWHCRQLDVEVREAARFVFRNDAKRLTPFLLDDRSQGGGGGEDAEDAPLDDDAPANDPASEKPATEKPAAKKPSK